MAVKMLMFDYRETEKAFFEKNKFEDFDITFYEKPLNAQTLAKIPQEVRDSASVISVFITSEVTEAVVHAFKNLRLISTRSTGFDHINTKACRNKNIAVINVESYGSTSVVQFTLGLIISLVRNIIPAYNYVKAPETSCQSFVGRDLSKLTLGVAGTGATGAAISQIAKAIGMNVIAYDIKEKHELAQVVKYVDFAALLKDSDIITLHVPYTGNNKHMFSAKEFEAMKDTAYFINTSRGELVNLKDLFAALESGCIKGAALDVLTCESFSFHCSEFSKGLPLRCTEEMSVLQDLLKLPNVIITPHIAYETQDSIDLILEKTIYGVCDYLKGESGFRVV